MGVHETKSHPHLKLSRSPLGHHCRRPRSPKLFVHVVLQFACWLVSSPSRRSNTHSVRIAIYIEKGRYRNITFQALLCSWDFKHLRQAWTFERRERWTHRGANDEIVHDWKRRGDEILTWKMLERRRGKSEGGFKEVVKEVRQRKLKTVMSFM